MINEQLLVVFFAVNMILVGLFLILAVRNKLPETFQSAVNKSGIGLSKKWATIIGVIIIIGAVKNIIVDLIL